MFFVLQVIVSSAPGRERNKKNGGYYMIEKRYKPRRDGRSHERTHTRRQKNDHLRSHKGTYTHTNQKRVWKKKGNEQTHRLRTRSPKLPRITRLLFHQLELPHRRGQPEFAHRRFGKWDIFTSNPKKVKQEEQRVYRARKEVCNYVSFSPKFGHP